MSGKRKLTDEEHVLWKGVTRSISELRRRRARAAPPDTDDAPRQTPKPPRSVKPRTPAAPVSPTAPSPSPAAALERRLKQRIARGTHAIDDRIDLHGLTQAQAHDALRRFLRMAQAKGAKVVLVITGKGGPPRADGKDDGERGVLKRQVPMWLRGTELRAAVIGFEAAGAAHGGAGALYVRLRKVRA